VNWQDAVWCNSKSARCNGRTGACCSRCKTVPIGVGARGDIATRTVGAHGWDVIDFYVFNPMAPSPKKTSSSGMDWRWSSLLEAKPKPIRKEQQPLSLNQLRVSLSRVSLPLNARRATHHTPYTIHHTIRSEPRRLPKAHDEPPI
jgi:hypothetical protein